MNEELPLRDLHLPDQVAWWPLAIGWWILLGLVLLGGVYWLWRRHRISHALETKLITMIAGIKEDPGLNDQERLTQLCLLLKRYAITRSGREHVAGLIGSDWTAWLSKHLGSELFVTQFSNLLLEDAYSPSSDLGDLEGLFALCINRLELLAKASGRIRLIQSSKKPIDKPKLTPRVK